MGCAMAKVRMGMPAKPNAIRAIEGSRVSSKAVSPPLMQIESADEWRDKLLTSDLQKWLWDRYVEEMRAAKLLAGLDGALLAALCIEQVIYFQAAKDVAGHASAKNWGKLVAERGGNYLGPMAVGNKAFERMVPLAQQFGATPSARAKMTSLNTQMDLDFGDDLLGDLTDAELDQAIAEETGKIVKLVAKP